MLIPNKYNGYSRDGRRLYFMDTGDDTPSETKQTSVSELPEWAKPYAKDTLAKAAALTDINQNPYQQYKGERIAGFQPMQQQAFESAANMRPSEQLGLGTSLAGAAGLGALGTNYRAGRFSGGQFGNREAAQYMSPYIEQAMQPQLREAERASDIQAQQQRAQAVGAGAFGGSRQAIVEAERLRNLGQQQGDIRARGYQTAYEQAANQYNQDMARRMQAQQLGEQSRQYGASLGMQGLQTALQSAGQLGQLGQTQYGQQTGIIGLQGQMGAQQQQQAQRPLDMAYQDFLNQQNYPYKQLGFMSDMVRGLPLGQQSTSNVYSAPPSLMGQLGGLGMGAYGLSKLMADGGLAYADGGVTDLNNVESILSKLSDQQLQQAKEAALNRRDMQEAQMIDAEMAARASMRSGIAPAIPESFADSMEQSMATGGIVALADGDLIQDPNELTEADYNLPSLSQIRDFFTPKAALENRQRYERGLAEAEKAKPKAEPAPKTGPAPKAEIPVINLPPKEQPASKQAPKQAPKAAPSGSIADALPSRKEVKSAVAELAEKSKLNPDIKDDVTDSTMKIMDELGKRNQPILDELRRNMEEQKPDTAAMKEKGLAQALAAFGFSMAEKASKRGREGYGPGIAGAIASAAAASPVLSETAAKTDKLIQDRQDNYAKLKMDQAKYEVALAKSDMQTAATLAGQIRAGQQADKLLQFHIADAQDRMALERDKLAQSAAQQRQLMSKYETVGGLTRDIMANEGLPYDKALEKAGNILKGGIAAGIRGDVTSKVSLAKELDKIEATYPPMMRSGTSKMAQDNQRAYDAAIRRAYSIYGDGASGNMPPASAPSANSGQWGELRVKP